MPFEERFRLCEEFAWHPRIIVTDLEKDLGFTRSINTVRELKKRFPATSFAWITGMDVAHQLHRWYRWRDLLDEIAMVHICRPPAYSVIANTPVRLLSGRRHIYPETAARYSLQAGLSYWILQKKMIDISSTNLRRQKLLTGNGRRK
jgi:nicotinate-nucleotide adenylyltransferase